MRTWPRLLGPGARQDDGFVVAEWAVGMAVLVIPVVLLMAVLPTWSARHEAAAAAAREATRTAVAAIDTATAHADAHDAAAAVLGGRGIPLPHVQVDVRLPPGPDRREGTVEATVDIAGAVVWLPVFGEVTGPSVSATHARRLDPYRSRAR